MPAKNNDIILYFKFLMATLSIKKSINIFLVSRHIFLSNRRYIKLANILSNFQLSWIYEQVFHTVNEVALSTLNHSPTTGSTSHGYRRWTKCLCPINTVQGLYATL